MMSIVIGGGIAGLSLAWALTRKGRPVTVVDASRTGGGASAVTSAYLEPRPGTGALRKLEWAGLAAWPRFASELETESGMSVDFRADGQIRLGNAEDLAGLCSDARDRIAWGWTPTVLDRKGVYAQEPGLAAGFAGGVLLPEVASVDGPQTCAALARAIGNAGGRIVEETPVVRVEPRPDGAIRVETTDGSHIASHVVVCSANGTGRIEGLPADVPPCRPVSGTTVNFTMEDDAPVTGLLRLPSGTVLTPRSDGRVMAGASHAQGEPDEIATLAAARDLVEDALAAVPGLAAARNVSSWTGVRAFVGDGLLRLGASSHMPGLYYSLSHAGAGYLRAPVIAEELAQFVLAGDAPCPAISPFLKRRG